MQLRPIKRKEISQKIAEKLNLSFETVDEIITCYFKSVQKKLSNLEYERLTVDGFGTFFIKKQKLEAKLEGYRNALAQTEAKETPDMSDFSYILALRTEIKKFERMMDVIQKEEQNKEKKKEQKKNYKNK